MLKVSDLVKDIDNILAEMDANRKDIKAKGTLGEKAVFRICEEIYRIEGGILYHSFTYKVDPEKEGNIKIRADGKYDVENLGSTTEIDILLVTPYRIFPIEVKSYSVTSGRLVLTNGGIEGCLKTDKSPVHQNEMHCRHLYSHVFKAIPNGETKYIMPIVVFVDRCKLDDNRSVEQKRYIPATTLDYVESIIRKFDEPQEYRLDLKAIDKALKECCTGYEKCLPCRVLK